MTDAVPGRRTRAQELVDNVIADILHSVAAERYATFETLARQVDEETLSLEAAIALQRDLGAVVTADVPVNTAIQGRALRKLALDDGTERGV